MQLLRRWLPASGSINSAPGGASLSRQLTRLLIAAGSLLLLLIVAQLAALTVNRMITARLVEQRIAPMSQLQTIASAYQTSWAIADKVRIGTIDETGGATALRDIQTRLARDWQELGTTAPDIAANFASHRPEADESLARLHALLLKGDHDRLDFFLSGQFYGGVDPLLGRIAQATTDLRATAGQDRVVLRWVNFSAEMLLILVTLGAMAGGAVIARKGENQIVRPLAAIADHVQRARREDEPADTVPGLGRGDEIGAIATALVQAEANARLAEQSRRERRQAEHDAAERRRELEQTLRAREHEDALALQARSRLVESHFARFDAVLSQLVSALAQASSTMREMATSLASASAQSRDRADAVAQSVAAAAARVDEAQKESHGLMKLVADVRGTAATTRTHSSDVIEESARNRAHAQQLSQLVGGIARALDLITRIAAQTNLLSVNANIEAHRSGEAGLGFTIVAREIKTLAVDSGQAAGEIARQLDRIKETAGDFLNSASLVERLAGGVGEQADSVDALAGRQADASQRMVSSIAHTRTEMREITAAAQDARQGSADLVVTARKLLETADSVAGQIADLSHEFTALRINLSEAA